MDLKELAYVGYYGYGYYSGAEEYIGVLCKKDMVDELCTIAEEYIYIGDLDGKHSQVQAELNSLTSESGILQALALNQWALSNALHHFDFDQLETDRADEIVQTIKQLSDEFDNMKIVTKITYELVKKD